MTAVIESYIVIDANNIAWVADTRIKVIEIALDKLAHGCLTFISFWNLLPADFRLIHPSRILLLIHKIWIFR